MPASKQKKEHATTPPSPICLSLQKFSHATVVQNSVGPLPWNHIVSHGDIFALFETVRTLDADGTMRDCKRFKIVQDPNVMENLDLEALATETSRAIDMARDASDHNRDHNAAVIKKVPVIAVKYPMSGRQVKRFQIRFTTDADFYEALKQFAQAGVHMLEAGTFPANRPQTAQQSYHPEPPQMPLQPMTAGNTIAKGISAPSADGTRATDTASDLMRPPKLPGLAHNSFPMQHLQPQASFNRSGNDQISLMPSNDGFGRSIDARDPPDLQQAAAGLNDAAQIVPASLSRPGTIDLYTPRPSTAPVQVSQHLSQMLPAKRKLPFNNPTVGVSSPNGEAAYTSDAHGLPPPTGGSVGGGIAAVETIIPNSQDSEALFPPNKAISTGTTTKSKKQTTQAQRKSTPKAPTRAKAKKCSACRKRGARTRCRHRQDSPQLSSIEEIFQPDTTVDEPETIDSKIDTQALLSRAASTKKTATNRSTAKSRNNPIPPPTTRMTRSMSVAARETEVEDGAPATDTYATKSAQKPLSTLLCTPADQLINANTPASLPAQAPKQIFYQHPPSPSQAQSQGAGEAAATHERILNELGRVLGKQPAFADADRKLGGFSSLAINQQRDVLEQFCIQMYKNPDFRVLCRALDASHRAQLALTL